MNEGQSSYRLLIVMGVSGSGKSTVAQALARRIGAEFLDADDYHSLGNIEKMSRGVPLSDIDREGWLTRLAKELTSRSESPRPTVLACSALREKYRQRLRVSPAVRFVYLKGSLDLIESRMNGRQGHFMNPDLLRSQFATLEEPAHGPHTDVWAADVALPIQTIVDLAIVHFQLRSIP